MLRVKSDKSDWFWSQSIVFTKPLKTGMKTNRNVVGRGQRSRFLVLTKRSAASGDENVTWLPLLGDMAVRMRKVLARLCGARVYHLLLLFFL